MNARAHDSADAGSRKGAWMDTPHSAPEATGRIAWSEITALTFDCYGTLIDWESGLLESVMPLLSSHGRNPSELRVLELFAELEREAEQGTFRDYKSVLRFVMEGLAAEYHFALGAMERECLVDSLVRWPTFPDTVDSLQTLKKKFRLGVISNIDDELFLRTREQLGVSFDWLITSERVKSYKPSLLNFRYAFQQIGLPPERIVHVAQSLYHDIAPANQLGLSSVWVNRRHGKRGPGATPPAEAKPDVVVFDLESLVALAGR